MSFSRDINGVFCVCFETGVKPKVNGVFSCKSFFFFMERGPLIRCGLHEEYLYGKGSFVGAIAIILFLFFFDWSILYIYILYIYIYIFFLLKHFWT